MYTITKHCFYDFENSMFFELFSSLKSICNYFSELNDSKNKVFPKSFTYAAEFNIAVSFNMIFLLAFNSVIPFF